MIFGDRAIRLRLGSRIGPKLDFLDDRLAVRREYLAVLERELQRRANSVDYLIIEAADPLNLQARHVTGSRANVGFDLVAVDARRHDDKRRCE